MSNQFNTQQKSYILNEKKEIIGFGEENFFVRQIPRDFANQIIREKHYSKKVTMTSYIHLGLFISGELKGVLQFGHAMVPKSRETLVPGTEKDQYLELNRMWISDDAGEYPETRAISAAVKFIKGRYPRIKWIQSFADERCKGFGIVYQAASFKYFGEHLSAFWELDGVFYHNITMTIKPGTPRFERNEGNAKFLQTNRHRATKHVLRQFRYIKFIDERWRKRCTLKEKAYPKHYLESSKH